MKLYNTLTRSIEEFTPLEDNKVKLYACGLTVYDFTHLGHLRKYTMDDVLIRMLRHENYDVTFVQNITDVGHLASDADTGEDKLEKGAKKYNETVWDVAKRFEDYFWQSMDAMGNVRPDISCRATDHISAQLEMVKKLEEQGFTYVIENDGVYFDTSKLDDYGKLAKLNVEEQKEGARVEKVAGKRNPSDFALWKFEREGENRAMVWESPWHERSFPGWHIECSAMAMHYLGEQLDIHTGGIDHIPVHHTNEIAQSEAFSGKKPFVKYWVHHNFLRVDGEKMSKSLGNFYTIDDVQKKGFHPSVLRFYFFSSHYRSELNFTWESLAGVQKSFAKLLQQVEAWQAEDRVDLSKEQEEKELALYDKFWNALRDDLKTPEAVATVWEVAKSDLPGFAKYRLLQDFDEILGVDFDNPRKVLEELEDEDQADIPPEIEELLDERQVAREQKDWQKSDEIRDQIKRLGFEVLDTDAGQEVKKSE